MGSSASLDRHPGKKNWVEAVGELPPFVREVAREVEKSGKTLESAIAIAISRIKVWAPKNAKAAKALAQWEALKAKAAARRAVKASVLDDIEFAADLVSLTAFEDYMIRLSLGDE